ncbi:MAG: ABC transporter substrate-binding protein [Candidatus Vogelbacteria bacterium]|nr:ABC transporter substrate-binding protein [Candidatus Vogelbacteria bacterium]
MSTSTKWVLAIIVIILIITGVWYYGAKPATQTEAGSIKVGFIGPLTGSAAAWGIEKKNTLEIAKDEINKAGGINGRQLEIVYEDGKCDGKESATAAQKLINIDKVKILTTSCSSETLAVAPIAESNKVLVMAVWPTNSKISEAGDYIFRVSYSDADTAKIMATAIGSKYKSIGVLTEQTDYATGLSDLFKKYYQGKIYEERFPQESKDVRTQLTKILSSKPETIFLNPDQSATGLEALKQLKVLGFKGPVYGNFFGGSEEVVKSPNAQNMIFFADPSVSNSPTKKELLDKYVALYDQKPDFEYAVAATYDSINILKQAMAQVGDDPTKLKDYLYTVKDFNGLLGTYGFDQNGDLTGSQPAAKQIVNKQVVSL